MLNDRLGDMGPYLADILVVLGVVIMTLGVVGVIRMPDVYTKMHAASKAVFLGTISFAVASIVTNEWEIIARVILIAGILMITTPVASQVIARAAAIEHELMRSPGAVDESVYDLVLRDELAYLPCQCPVCSSHSLQDLRGMQVDQRTIEVAKHNLHVLKAEVDSVKQAIMDGRLWEYVMQKARAHPKLMEAARLAGGRSA